jgi:hypothetical protein
MYENKVAVVQYSGDFTYRFLMLKSPPFKVLTVQFHTR